MSLNLYEKMGLVQRDGEWAEPGEAWSDLVNSQHRPFSSRSKEYLNALGYVAGEMLVETIGHENIAVEEPEHFGFTLQIFGDTFQPPLSSAESELFVEAGKAALRDWNHTHVIDTSQVASQTT